MIQAIFIICLLVIVILELAQITGLLQRLVLSNGRSANLTFTQNGDPLMPATIVVGGNGAKAVFTEFSGPGGTGSPVPPVGTVGFTNDNPSVATVDANGNCTAVGPGTTTVTGTDSGNGLTASDALTVTPAVAQSATLVLTAN